jgi:hypothetical protein
MVRRVFAVLLAVAWIASFIAEPSLRGGLWILVVCPVAALIAISPKSLRDDRSNVWEDRHLVLLSSLMAVYTGLGCYLFLSYVLRDRLSIEIAIAFGIAYGVLIGVLGRRRHRAG